MDPTEVATRLLDAFNDGDRMRSLMEADLLAWVTEAERQPLPVTGADAYLDRVAAVNLPSVSYRGTPTQEPVARSRATSYCSWSS